MPYHLNAPMLFEKDITREIQLGEQLRIPQQDYRAQDVPLTWASRRNLEQRVKHASMRSSAGRTRPKQLTSRKKRPTLVVLQGVEIPQHPRRLEKVEVQTSNLVSEELGLIQALSPNRFQIGRNSTSDERSVH